MNTNAAIICQKNTLDNQMQMVRNTSTFQENRERQNEVK
jgi:hypothetical protein